MGLLMTGRAGGPEAPPPALDAGGADVEGNITVATCALRSRMIVVRATGSKIVACLSDSVLVRPAVSR
jgi:hypothetical protein